MYIEHEDSGWSDPRLTQSRVLYTAGLTSVYIEHEDSGWSDSMLTQSRVLYTAGLTSVYRT